MPDRPHFKTFRDEPDYRDEGAVATISDPLLSRHEIEQLIWRELNSTPGIHFPSLTVRRIGNGVCLTGVMEIEDEDHALIDICDEVRRIAPVANVVNQLVVREPSRRPRAPR